MPAQMEINAADIAEAARRLTGYIRETPLFELEANALGSTAKIFLKLEQLQYSGSFKVRGAFNTLLSSDIPKAGVIAASGGNHGAAVAFAATRMGLTAEIFVPSVTSPNKIRRIESYGIKPHIAGEHYQDALLASRAHAAKTGAMEIHAFDRPSILIGQGTLGRELEKQLPSLDTVLVACGGGGLIGGIAAWFDGKVRVIGVEPEDAPTLHVALDIGRPVSIPIGSIAADSLGASEVGHLMFPIAQRAIERVVLVSDDAIRATQRALWNEFRLMVEPGGATALSALLSNAYKPSRGERIAVLVCGGNVDPTTLGDG